MPGTARPTPAYTYPGIVVRVIDGDTLDAILTLLPQRLASLDGQDEWDYGFGIFGCVADSMRPVRHLVRLRLDGIDAPELESAMSGITPGHAAAFQLEALCGSRENVIVQSFKSGGFGRWAAKIWRQRDDLYINDEMVRLGHAAPWKPT